MPSMTITTTAPLAQRLTAAMGAELGLGRSATEAEIKAATIAWWRDLIQQYEKKQNEAALPAPIPFDPT